MPISKSPRWTTGGKIHEWRQNAPPFCPRISDASADRTTASDREWRQDHPILPHKNVIGDSRPQYGWPPQPARVAFETLRTYVNTPCRLPEFPGKCSDPAFVMSRASPPLIRNPQSSSLICECESPTTAAPSCSRLPSGCPRAPTRCASRRRTACGPPATTALR